MKFKCVVSYNLWNNHMQLEICISLWRGYDSGRLNNLAYVSWLIQGQARFEPSSLSLKSVIFPLHYNYSFTQQCLLDAWCNCIRHRNEQDTVSDLNKFLIGHMTLCLENYCWKIQFSFFHSFYKYSLSAYSVIA